MGRSPPASLLGAGGQIGVTIPMEFCKTIIRRPGYRLLVWVELFIKFVFVSTLHAAEKPVVPTYRIDRYELSGQSLLPDPVVQISMANAIGPRVGLAEIRRAMVQLQQAYKDHGYTGVSLVLPSQPLTNGVVVVQVVDAHDTSTTHTKSQPTLNAWKVPRYDVRHFVVTGNTALSPETLDSILAPVAGSAVDLAQLEAALLRLRAAYRERGYPHVGVTLPQQLLHDGTVSIQVNEGPSSQVVQRDVPQQLPATRPATIPKAPVFEVRRFDIEGNTLLRLEVAQSYLTNALGTNVTLTKIQSALGELQMAYRERGYATVSVGLPQQQLINGVVRVQVTEGVLTDIRVTGNRHFSSNNVVHSLPSLRTNIILNSRVFQRELDTANQNPDRQIYPTISPGPDPGTTALELRVKDRLPLHGRLDVDNYATQQTPGWRINTSVQYNNLWQEEHQVGFAYGFSPQQYKQPHPEPDLLLNRPLISYFSSYYRIPLGSLDSVEELLHAPSSTFGYNEATRQFVLPPAGTRPELIFYGSAAPSDTGIQYGPERVVTQTPLLTIKSQDTGQNLTWNDVLGGQFSRPWSPSDRWKVGISAGVDWKRYAQESYNTNNFTIITVVTNAQGSETIVTRVPSPQPARFNQLTYVPLNAGGNFSLVDRYGTLSGTLGVAGNFSGEDASFEALAYSRTARADYTKATLSLSRDQKLPGDWSLWIRGSGQGSPRPLISNEQFSLGGINSVRGYFEGQAFGDSGWFSSAELRTSYWSTRLPLPGAEIPTWIRGSVFLDAGEVFLMDRALPDNSDHSLLWGTGLGVSANLGQRAFLRLALGWPLADIGTVHVGEPHAYFMLEGQF